MPCLTPYRGDTSQMLLFKIASCLESSGGAVVLSFNGRIGDVILSLADVAAVADGRYVLKAGDTMTGTLVHPDGTAALPSITFTGTQTTGFFHPAAGSIGFTSTGVLKLTVSSTAIVPTVPILAPDSTEALPSYSFQSNTGLGLFRVNANSLGLSTSGVRRFIIDSTGNSASGPLGALPYNSSPFASVGTLLSNNAGGTWGIVSRDLTSMALGVGGSILFVGYKTGTSAAGNFAGIKGIKENGTAADESGALLFMTSGSSGVITEKLRISSLGTLLMAPSFPLAISSGTNQRAGDAVLVGGTIAVGNTTVTANTRVFHSRKTNGGTLGTISYTVTAGVGFTLTSTSGTDTSTVSYLLIEVP